MEKKIVTIEEWGLVSTASSPYSAPETYFSTLVGKVYGHPNFPDGHPVQTSRILGEKDGMVETNNTLYKLGKPSEAYINAMDNKENINQRLLDNLKKLKAE